MSTGNVHPNSRQIIVKCPEGYQRIVEGERDYTNAEIFSTESAALNWFLELTPVETQQE